MSIERGVLDIEIYYGDDDFRRLTFTTEDDTGNTVPHDLTVYDDIVMEAKARKSQGGTAVERWVLGDSLTIRGTGDNALQIDLQWDDTQALRAGEDYYYDIRFLQSGEVNTLIEGTLTVTRSVSERP